MKTFPVMPLLSNPMSLLDELKDSFQAKRYDSTLSQGYSYLVTYHELLSWNIYFQKGKNFPFLLCYNVDSSPT